MTTGIKILCTLGPSSLNPAVIRRLSDRGVSYFRINLSHTSLDQLASHIELIRGHSAVPICIDTEGAQVRSGLMPVGTALGDRQRITLAPGRTEGTATRIGLWPESALDRLEVGDLVAVDFDSVVLLVEGRVGSGVSALVLNGGSVGSNKAVNVYPPRPLPALSPKDIEAVAMARAHGITDFALSFASCAADVRQLRDLAGAGAHIMAKIESQSGVRCLDEILVAADAVLIDRGDLSREVPIENVPFLQKAIIRKANAAGRPVYVATNLLESMLTARKPTRAELNDVVNTLVDGANGLVLAAETAVGREPVRAIDILATLIDGYRRSLDGYRIEDLLAPTSMLLPPMHGSHRSTPAPIREIARVAGEGHLLDVEQGLDLEQILIGTYAPLSGFLTSSELEGVLQDYRLPGGTIWTMPILLQVPESVFVAARPGSAMPLRSAESGEALAVLHVEDAFEVDLARDAERWFGTGDPGHPGVARFRAKGRFCLGGSLSRVAGTTQARGPFGLTPAQTRMVLSIKGWRTVVGFHTRNVPHLAHEHIMRAALERANADGLFVHPVVGPKKTGDFRGDVILDAYDLVLERALPGALLGAFSSYSRYAGPREAVFTALCRKNFGCSHFVVGRDHTGVGDFYSPDASQRLFSLLGDLGIQPIFFGHVYSCPTCGHVESCEHGVPSDRQLSGTRVREMLRSGERLPDWFVRPELGAWLHDQRAAGRALFVE